MSDNEPKPLSQTIIELGDDFQVDAMEDFDERISSGEFADKSPEEIREIYLNEAIHDEQEQDEIDSILATEQAEEDRDNDD